MKQILIIFFLFLSLSLKAQGPQWMVYRTGNSGLPSNYILSLAVDHNNIVWIGTDSGLAQFKSNNWSTYNTSNSEIPSNIISGISIDGFNNVWISTIDSGAAVFDRESWIIFKTSNSGIQYNILACVYIDALNSKWFGTGGVSKYDGLNWFNFNTLNSNIPNSAVLSITSRSNELWVNTYHKGIARLIDTTWTVYNQANSPLPDDYTKVIYKDFENNIWVGMETGGIAKISENYNWEILTRHNSGLPSNWILEFLITQEVKWIGTGAHGLSRLIDTTWSVFNMQNSPLHSNTIYSLALDSNKNLWIGTASGLAVFNEKGIVGINEITQSIPAIFSLHQNYPNPFNPSTRIKFDIPKSSFVRLAVYDILGRQVAELVNEMVNAGSYEYEWYGAELGSGMYFYRLEAGDFIQTKRMVLVK